MTLRQSPVSVSFYLDDYGSVCCVLTENSVEIFVHWLYTKTLFDPVKCELGFDYCATCQDMEEHRDPNNCLPAIKAYVLGDRLAADSFRQDAAAFANTVITSETFALSYFYKMVLYAFKHIPYDRPILQHLVDEHCETKRKAEDIEKNVEVEMKLPAAFTRRVMHQCQKLVKINETANANKTPSWQRKHLRCYKVHTDSEEEDCGLRHMKWNEKTELGHFPELV
jgi:hypothetical protein